MTRCTSGQWTRQRILKEMIEEAFVTYTNAEFAPLAEVLVRGLQRFSSRPIIVFGVNTTLEFEYPNLISRRLDVDPGRHIYYVKLRALQETRALRAIYLDSDMVPTRTVDELFSAIPQGRLPLLPRHPRQMAPRYYEVLMHRMGVPSPTLPYSQACIVAFTRQCRKFFVGCRNLARSLDESQEHPPCFDETILNLMLWDSGADSCLPTCHLSESFFSDYLEGRLDEDPTFRERYGDNQRFHAIHGCKDPERAAGILERLEQEAAEWEPDRY